MASVKLFDIVGEKVTLTDHCYTIEYLNNIIKKYGKSIACKIFAVFQYMSDLNPETNPFANISEVEKLETIIRAVCPKLPIEIDWLDEDLEEGIELTRKQFETGSYRVYLANKTLRDKLVHTIQNSHVSVTKDDSNISELDRALKMLDVVNEATRKAFSEFEAENGSIQRKGGRKAVTRTIGGKAVELE